MSGILIRSAKLEDAPRLLEIYAYYVTNTAISFEYQVPTLLEFQNRIRNTLTQYPYLVVEKDGVIQGYTYASRFHARAAYDWDCEISIYLAHTAKKCGLGRMLYEALEEKLRESGFLNMYACIADLDVEDEYLTHNSVEFHTHLGFSKVGEFHQCGYKFQRWYHMVYMEKLIGVHQAQQPPVAVPGSLDEL